MVNARSLLPKLHRNRRIQVFAVAE